MSDKKVTVHQDGTVTEIENLLERYWELRLELSDAQEEYGSKLQQIERDIATIIFDDNVKRDRISFSLNHGHFCKPSPIKVCVYDLDNDPSRDECIYCHDPYERK